MCFLKSLPNSEHSNFLIVSVFYSKYFSSETSLLVKNSYLPIFPDDKADILAVYLFKLS